MKALEVYLKTAWALKTPLVFLLDSKYKIPYFEAIESISLKFSYMADYSDCDDAAVQYKAEASKRFLNAVGIVFGFYHGQLHLWNMAITKRVSGAESVHQIEPQSKYVFKWNKHYRPILVII